MKTLSFTVAIAIGVLCMTSWGCSRPARDTIDVPTPTTGSTNSIAADTNTPSPGTKKAYPQEVEDEFLRSCQSAGSSPKFCGCVFDKIQGKYSLEEFSVIELKLSSGNPPDEFVEFTGRAKAQCMR